MAKRLWCKLESALGPIKVYVVLTTEVDGENCSASYDPESHVIEVTHTPNEGMMRSRLLHELLHVCMGSTAGDLRAKVLGANTEDARSIREELIVSFLEPHLYDLLNRNGLLKIPKPPKLG